MSSGSPHLPAGDLRRLLHLVRDHAAPYRPEILSQVLRRRLLNLPLFNSAIKALSFLPSLQPFLLFSILRLVGLIPDRETFAPLLKSCALLPSRTLGTAIHAASFLAGFSSHGAISIQLVQLYAQFGHMYEAHKLFDKMPQKEIVVWNLMINGFFKSNDFESGSVLFRRMRDRNVVTWNTMIAGSSRVGRDVEAVELFLEMLGSGFDPDDATVVTVLPICGRLGNSELGRGIHIYVEKSGFLLSAIHVGNSLIDMYSKCGDLESAGKVFDEMSQKNVVTWNTMIHALGINGKGDSGLQMFDEMVERGFPSPNSSTFMSVLGCCTHTGMVERGKELVGAMEAKFEVRPGVEHYGCLVDGLGRCGRTSEALELIEGMPMRPTAAIWGALLGACRNNGDVEVGEKAARMSTEIEPDNSGNFVLMANLYAEAGRWEEAEKVWSVMRSRRVWKNAAQSAVEWDG